MPNLDEYVNRVLDDQDKILMSEASSCFEAGALRAAYITVWLAVAESLKRKFVEAANRDSTAGQIVGEVGRREAAHRAVDGLLLDKAKDYGFVTDAEHTRLNHLRENRNVSWAPV